MDRRVRWLAGLSVVAAGAGLVRAFTPHDPHEPPAAAVADTDAPKQPSEQAARYMGLKTAEVDFGTVRRIVRLTGTVRAMPERQQLVTGGAAGTLTKLDVRIGDRVKKGQTIGAVRSAELARMVNDLYKTQIDYEHANSEVALTTANNAQLRTQITASEAQHKLLQDEAARLEKGGDVVGGNVLSQKRAEVVQQQAQVSTLHISQEQGLRMLESLEKIKVATGKSIVATQDVIDIIHAHPEGIDLAEEKREEGESGGTFLLHAQLDGVVIRRDAVLGQGIEPGKPIATIADYSQVLIEGELPESMIAGWDAAKGAEVRIRRPGGGSAPSDGPVAIGHVKGIGPTVDPIKRTALVLIEAENPAFAGGGAAMFEEGMFVSLAVDLGSVGEQVVVVPASSLISDGAEPFVFVQEKGTPPKYVKRDVVPGARDDRMVEIKDGLVPGDVVVTSGAYLLTQLRSGSVAAEEGHHHEH